MQLWFRWWRKLRQQSFSVVEMLCNLVFFVYLDLGSLSLSLVLFSSSPMLFGLVELLWFILLHSACGCDSSTAISQMTRIWVICLGLPGLGLCCSSGLVVVVPQAPRIWSSARA
ncbi:hypothetical protein RchiOBHm_Chr6g0248171 [Rosa chinensis]|uniref:Uncharacterized protein n=1 Tax=Rosa chinensis TaxID=74649 RepID=A0A2P6PJZ7_ROSCH|nr:hypothetical protein RchiOBHm_Chr6g0248171 [Rosa chinensis]